jgi:hypothetical protein
MSKNKPDRKDPFGPPRQARDVTCLHCEQTYSSSLIVWKGDCWCCPTPKCGGAGYGYDIHDAQPSPQAGGMREG